MQFQITINEKGGPTKSLEFDKTEVTIGRVQGNDIVLPKGNISKRHSKIVVKEGKFVIIDSQSTNGTYVNGKKITAPQIVRSGDKIYIGDFTLQLVPAANGGAAASAEARAPTRAKSRDDDEPKAGKGGSPGLIDDSFDKEFEGGFDSKPDGRSAKQRTGKSSVGEEGFELDLGGGEPEPEPEAEPEAGLDEEPPPDDEFDSEPAAEEEEEPPEEPEPEPEPEAEAGGLELDLEPERPTPPPPKKPVAAPAKPASVAPPPPSKLRLPAPVKPEPEPPPEEPEDSAAMDDDETGAPPPSPAAPAPAAAAVAPMAAPVAAGAVVMAGAPASVLTRAEVIRLAHLRLAEELDLRARPIGELAALRSEALPLAERFCARLAREGRLEAAEEASLLAELAVEQSLDLGPLAEFYDDKQVLEVMITQKREILVERTDVRLKKTEQTIESERDVVRLIRCLAVLGGADPTAPLVDVRLRDGSRVLAAQPPFAFRGPTLNIRKADRDFYSAADLVANQALGENMKDLLGHALRHGKSVLVSMGPGPVGSSTINGIVSLVIASERIVTIENGIDLLLIHENATALEPRPGAGVAELVAHAIALQPDRAVVGPVTGADVLPVVSALAGPLHGSIACYAASSPEEVLDRMAGEDLAERVGDRAAARRLVARAFPLIVQEHRINYFRMVTRISELVIEDGEVKIEDVFRFEPTGVDENGDVQGEFRATGYTPSFLADASDVDLSIFEA